MVKYSLFAFILLAGILACGSMAWADFPAINTMETDSDNAYDALGDYVPDGHPLDNPGNIHGMPPYAGYAGTSGGGYDYTDYNGWIDARFGGGIVDLPGIAAGAHHRRDIDDATGARLHHAAQDGFG